ncbi:hypothetical protein TNCV_3745181 [Trichonephila clavipes]|nr:hypothetical protein TNCV_3745181 [Trichonephila clavipes]
MISAVTYQRYSPTCLQVPRLACNYPAGQFLNVNLYANSLPILGSLLSVSECMNIDNITLFSNSRAFDDRPHNFEPCSSNEDDTCSGTPSPNFHTLPMIVLLASTYLT